MKRIQLPAKVMADLFKRLTELVTAIRGLHPDSYYVDVPGCSVYFMGPVHYTLQYKEEEIHDAEIKSRFHRYNTKVALEFSNDGYTMVDNYTLLREIEKILQMYVMEKI